MYVICIHTMHGRLYLIRPPPNHLRVGFVRGLCSSTQMSKLSFTPLPPPYISYHVPPSLPFQYSLYHKFPSFLLSFSHILPFLILTLLFAYAYAFPWPLHSYFTYSTFNCPSHSYFPYPYAFP